MLYCATYNCNSIRNNSEVVKNLLSNVDILCLQELMLNKSDLGILDQFNPDFEYVAYVRDREACGINEGRPTAGVAIFWKRYLSPCIKTVSIDDSMIGIILSNGKENIFILNVYLPCDLQTIDALDSYRNSLARLKLVIEEQDVSDLIILGVFNADPFKGRFWRELLSFCQSLSLSILDKQLPNDTFTYLCPARNNTSWLDHILCSSSLLQNISNVVVGYESAIFDHFPLHLSLEFCTEVSNSPTDEDFIGKFVNWSRLSANDKNK